MNFLVCFILLALAVVSTAFQSQPLVAKRNTLTQLQMNGNGAGRAMRIATGVATVLSASVLQLTPVQAANYGGFGSSYAEVVDPKTAVMNEETSSSEDVKSALATLKAYQSAISTMKADLGKDPQTALSKRLQSELGSAQLRVAMNKYNAAFAEDTQRGTDRLIRLILQDVTELEREVALKPGKTRQESKVKLINKRLSAAEESLKELVAFYPK